MIEIKNITKIFVEDNNNQRKVLDNISTTFEAGKINFIIGKSGSGKTVLLKSLVGLHDVTEGEILYDGICYNHLNSKEKNIVRQKSGMLFQGGALFDSSTVLENVKFPLDVFTNMTEKEKIATAHKCLERVGLMHALNLYPSEISGGMVKRASIARAIVVNPKYLFCDEPNSGLDPKTSLVIDALIKEITQEYNITTIINSHDMNSVIEIGDNISFIYEGKLWWQGTSANILSSDNEELNEFVFASNMAKIARTGLDLAAKMKLEQ